jgi:hypothetical protein
VVGNGITKPKEEVSKVNEEQKNYYEERKVEEYEVPRYELSRNGGKINDMETFERKGNLRDVMKPRSLMDLMKPKKQNGLKRLVSKADRNVFDIRKYEELFDKEEKKVTDVADVKENDILVEQKKIEVPFTGKSISYLY